MFERRHRFVAHALVLCSFMALALSGELAAWVVGAFLGAWAISLLWRPRAPEGVARMGWNAVVLGAFVLLVARGVQTGNWVMGALHFALLVTASRMLQCHTARDFSQLYGLSFVLMVLGAVVNPTLQFAGLFLVWVVLAVWALVLLHLRVLAERRGGHGGAGVAFDALRSLLGPRFFAALTGVAAGVLVLAAVAFAAFPRVGLGILFGQGRRPTPVTGFSDRIELGHFGTIRQSTQVVARVELPDESGPAPFEIRLRGLSFDAYDGRTWTRSARTTVRHVLPMGRDGWQFVRTGRSRPTPAQRSVRQRIYLEPLDTDVRVLFAMPFARAVRMPRTRLDIVRGTAYQPYEELPAGDLVYGGGRRGGVDYEVVSELPADPDPARLDGHGWPGWLLAVYTQVPRDLDPRVEALARQVTAGAASPLDKARAIEAWLQRHYAYDTYSPDVPRDPIATFLFERKRGHCEYFATAMVLMLRTLGIPARPVNGFVGGAWNAFGRYYEIRQGDAHSWVEVYLPGVGWSTFDPTPPSGRGGIGGTGLLGALSRWFDALRLQWYRWVVEYDLDKQVGLFRGAWARLARLHRGWLADGGAQGVGGDEATARQPGTAIPPWGWALGLGLLALATAVVFHRARRGRGRRARLRREWERLLRTLRRFGVETRPSTTSEDLLRIVRRVAPEACEAVGDAVRAYDAARFSARPLPVASVRTKVADAVGALRRARRRGG